MIKKLFVALLSLLAAAAFAAVDVNKASQAELESIKGIGPAIASKILDERKKASFKDWNDMVVRVKGVGERNATKFSSEGLTVNGAAFAGAPAAMKNEAAAKTERTAKADAATKTETTAKTQTTSMKESRAGQRAAKRAGAASAPAATTGKK